MGIPPIFVSSLTLGLFLGVLFDGEFTSVVAALGAYMVVHDLCAAIAASSQLSALQRVVRSSLGRSGLRESVFWMWHIITFLIIYFKFLSASHRGSISLFPFSSSSSSSVMN